MLNNISIIQYHETIESLQFHKLMRQANKNTEEWIGRIRVVVIECTYKELDRHLKKQFIQGLIDTDMLAEKSENQLKPIKIHWYLLNKY